MSEGLRLKSRHEFGRYRHTELVFCASRFVGLAPPLAYPRGVSNGWRATAVVAEWRRNVHCLSYTAVFWNDLPVESVPFVFTVRVLPLPETTMLPVTVTLSAFLAVNSSVWSSTFL